MLVSVGVGAVQHHTIAIRPDVETVCRYHQTISALALYNTLFLHL